MSCIHAEQSRGMHVLLICVQVTAEQELISTSSIRMLLSNIVLSDCYNTYISGINIANVEFEKRASWVSI